MTEQRTQAQWRTLLAAKQDAPGPAVSLEEQEALGFEGATLSAKDAERAVMARAAERDRRLLTRLEKHPSGTVEQSHELSELQESALRNAGYKTDWESWLRFLRNGSPSGSQ